MNVDRLNYAPTSLGRTEKHIICTIKLEHLQSNSDKPNKDGSLNGATEDKSDEIVEHLESNSDVPIKEES